MGQQRLAPGMPGHTVEQLAANAQREAVLSVAAKGSCVIVGRCADYILHERLDCLHVFICADSINRGQRILERYGANEKPVQKRIEDKDARRRIYYSHYTDRIWGAPQNYHLCLNSSALGEENCIQTIIRLFEGDGDGDR